MSMDARIGQRIGDYKLVRLLGTGSFGKVYYAERAKTEQPAAVKLFHAELTPEKLKDFLNEAQTVFLVHPNIVKFFGFNVTNDKIPYIIMEYAPQGSLRQRHLYGKPLSLNTVIAYVKPIVAGLQYAHDQGRVHRDIKPENILVSADGEIWVGDFGISVVAHSTSSQGTADSRGTAPYMAPEHWRGKATNASDQYSL